MKCIVFFTILAATILITCATKGVYKCDEGGEYEDDVVTISDCDKSPCKLLKGNEATVILKFKAEKDCSEVINKVTARIGSAEVPYIGVHGQKSCDKITKADGSKAECPLKSGEEYIYTNKIAVLKIYPTMSTTVTWGLACENEEIISCFKVKAQIVSH